ncbi:MAG: sensor histidine kinase [Haloarculaceae archaeon]
MAAPSETQIQVLYEIALAIRPEADLESTVESAVSTYLQKLNCSAAAVFETGSGPDGDLTHDLVTALPEQSSLTDSLGSVRERLPDDEDRLHADLPLVEELDTDTHRYVMELPEFGVLVLYRRGDPLEEAILLSLGELNEKLATACNRVVVQDQYETQYRELFEEAPVMFALTRDADGGPVVADCNREFASRLGYSREGIRGRPLAEFYTEESRRTLKDEGYDRALAGEFGTEERVFETRDGRKLHTQARATPRRDRRGDVIGTHVLYVDVTKLKRRNQQLTVLNRVLRHNIRNDLTAIEGYLEMAMETADTETRSRLSDVQSRTESLLSTSEVADRIRRTLDRTGRARQDIGEVLGLLADRARMDYPQATIDTAVESVTVQASAALEYALWELIENACEHAGDRPQVDVSVRKNGEVATVTVADDGPGIPEQERRILGQGEETQLDHGSGLGLWLVYWVLENSGGGLDFDCEAGTEVSVALPMAESGD